MVPHVATSTPHAAVAGEGGNEGQLQHSMLGNWYSTPIEPPREVIEKEKEMASTHGFATHCFDTCISQPSDKSTEHALTLKKQLLAIRNTVSAQRAESKSAKSERSNEDVFLAHAEFLRKRMEMGKKESDNGGEQKYDDADRESLWSAFEQQNSRALEMQKKEQERRFKHLRQLQREHGKDDMEIMRSVIRSNDNDLIQGSDIETVSALGKAGGKGQQPLFPQVELSAKPKRKKKLHPGETDYSNLFDKSKGQPGLGQLSNENLMKLVSFVNSNGVVRSANGFVTSKKTGIELGLLDNDDIRQIFYMMDEIEEDKADRQALQALRDQHGRLEHALPHQQKPTAMQPSSSRTGLLNPTPPPRDIYSFDASTCANMTSSKPLATGNPSHLKTLRGAENMFTRLDRIFDQMNDTYVCFRLKDTGFSGFQETNIETTMSEAGLTLYQYTWGVVSKVNPGGLAVCMQYVHDVACLRARALRARTPKVEFLSEAQFREKLPDVAQSLLDKTPHTTTTPPVVKPLKATAKEFVPQTSSNPFEGKGVGKGNMDQQGFDMGPGFDWAALAKSKGRGNVAPPPPPQEDFMMSKGNGKGGDAAYVKWMMESKGKGKGTMYAFCLGCLKFYCICIFWRSERCLASRSRSRVGCIAKCWLLAAFFLSAASVGRALCTLPRH